MVRYTTGLKFVYPDKIDGHMIDPEQVRDVPLDGEYPFYNSSKWFRFWQNMLNFLFWTLAIPLCSIRYGLKVKGRKNLRGNHAGEIKNGFITTCNHVFDWDYLCVRTAMFPKRSYYLAWINNHNSKLGKLMRVTGSIPIPHMYEGMRKFDHDIKRLFIDKRWLHVYPEASMWYYEEGIRPFKNGTFSIAYDNQVPVIPLAISYRPARGICKLWKRHGYPCVTISIGEPQWPNFTLDRRDSITDLNERVHNISLKMKEAATPFISEEKQSKINAQARI
ncbi:MAG TPA: lysophospholipid acyltransferase family protein [Bacilli bacterium]|nr:lysophospholipid acyltransferase family protein [Bacilli bacterium]HPS18617.1 lysophospholipid acyltransferase family protein [Bacilli bacterium]